QVRWAKVPITSANFDDRSVATAVPFMGAPAPPGQSAAMTIGGFLLDTHYYFAVAGTVGTPQLVGLMSTPTAVRARLMTSILSSPTGTTQLFGSGVYGSADVTGDGLSDLLIGTSGDTHASLYFGSVTFAPAVPSVIFT